jgi:hypothetical protein
VVCRAFNGAASGATAPSTRATMKQHFRPLCFILNLRSAAFGLTSARPRSRAKGVAGNSPLGRRDYTRRGSLSQSKILIATIHFCDNPSSSMKAFSLVLPEARGFRLFPACCLVLHARHRIMLHDSATASARPGVAGSQAKWSERAFLIQSDDRPSPNGDQRPRVQRRLCARSPRSSHHRRA